MIRNGLEQDPARPPDDRDAGDDDDEDGGDGDQRVDVANDLRVGILVDKEDYQGRDHQSEDAWGHQSERNLKFLLLICPLEAG